jgi:hypothetical protein
MVPQRCSRPHARRFLAPSLVALLVCGLAGGCSSPSVSTTPKIVFIGDSIAGNLERAIRTSGFDGPAGDQGWTFVSQAGAGWGEGENAQGNWPLGVVQGQTIARRIRGSGDAPPAAIVLELGTNDALRADFSFTLSDRSELSAQYLGLIANIDSDVAMARSITSCVVLVTPSAYRTSIYGEGLIYKALAQRVDQLLRAQAASGTHGATLIADWAAVSSSHHGVGSDGESWFLGDNIHLDNAGNHALAALVARTLSECPVPSSTG